MERLLINRLVIVLALCFWSSCNFDSLERQRTESLNRAEKFWIDFEEALKKEDIRYLLEHSLDTVQCGDCGLDSTGKSEFYKANFLFQKHLDLLKTTENFQVYSIFNDEGVYRVNYLIKSRQAPEGAYNVIYTFVDTPKGFLFQGMFPVP